MPTKPDVVYIGGTDWTTRDWDGSLDELTIFDRPLTKAEVGNLFKDPGFVSKLIAE